MKSRFSELEVALYVVILFLSSACPESWYAPVLSMVVSFAMRSIIFSLAFSSPLFLAFHAELSKGPSIREADDNIPLPLPN